LGGIIWRGELLLSAYAASRRAVSKWGNFAQKEAKWERFDPILLKKLNKM
jgi:hypothetical protein